ncbi:MAG: response regulator [Cyanobacteria bacterium CRU_2_1]|nr:response regulator [Cyanobacteria bacterium RU_5_0]NJR61288.1 response regulator [Cyanobacteria bacterium CRU_2_1]
MASKQWTVLVVEDSADSVLLLERAVERANIAVSLQIVGNGAEGVDYLLGRGDYGDRDRYPLPILILSNMRMPRMNGLEFLAWIKQQPNFSRIPVIVLSSAGEIEEVDRVMALGATAHFIKPFRLQDLVETIRQIQAFLPPSDSYT